MENTTTACFCPPPGEFLCLKRTWKNGDRIEIEFDMPTTLEAVEQSTPRSWPRPRPARPLHFKPASSQALQQDPALHQAIRAGLL